MPELPNILVYKAALRARVVGHRLSKIAIRSPFVPRTFDPPVDAAVGRMVMGVSRIGKRLVIEMEGDLFLVVHLMIAGRHACFHGGFAEEACFAACCCGSGCAEGDGSGRDQCA